MQFMWQPNDLGTRSLQVLWVMDMCTWQTNEVVHIRQIYSLILPRFSFLFVAMVVVVSAGPHHCQQSRNDTASFSETQHFQSSCWR